ncbi:MAG: hypothetical protein A2516_06310 [Alphaproteobacteria bacterium RIFOXYD12_FULL_60_8]|nr:MAG: hypothetical protein A2516_06310 [Alphaproteobacteria bacterium RIFOXYD12_FULL_60_8]
MDLTETSAQTTATLDPRSRPATKGDVVNDLLLKNPRTWTEDELKLVQAAVFDMSSSDPRRAMADAAVRAWYDHFYGTDPVTTDETGRPLEPQFKIQPPQA